MQVRCPHCENFIDVEDPDELVSGEVQSRKCHICDKSFGLSVESFALTCSTEDEHAWVPNSKDPLAITHLDCLNCGEAREPTDAEWRKIARDMLGGVEELVLSEVEVFGLLAAFGRGWGDISRSQFTSIVCHEDGIAKSDLFTFDDGGQLCIPLRGTNYALLQKTSDPDLFYIVRISRHYPNGIPNYPGKFVWSRILDGSEIIKGLMRDLTELDRLDGLDVIWYLLSNGIIDRLRDSRYYGWRMDYLVAEKVN